ncbi:MAG: spermidine synthase [Sporichthyaceae bacterium]
MSARFAELDYRRTPMGAISLRRRIDPGSGTDIFEVKLDDDFLMSSQFIVAEVEVARLALDRQPGTDLDVVVGGLGLGFTALAVLDDPRVRSLVVIEALPEIIEWHQRGLVPAGERLMADPRARLVQGDFFALVAGPGLDERAIERRFDAVIVDIDHSPVHHLNPAHAPFYTPAGLRALAAHLAPSGCFTLWSNDPPEPDFIAMLAGAFPYAAGVLISFPNPQQNRDATNSVYVGGAA